MSVGAWMFKDSSLMGTFPLPPLPPVANMDMINMISSFSNGSLRSSDPWVVPRPKDVESYGAHMTLTKIEIVYLEIPLASPDTCQQIHPYTECDLPTPLEWVVNSLCSHDFIDIEFPLEEAILEVMDSIENPKDEVMNRSYFHDLEPTRVSTMSLDPGLGEFVGASRRPLSLDPFLPQLSFSKLSIEFSSSRYTKDLCFVPPLHLVGHYKGVVIAHETTHDEYVCIYKFISMWHGPDMVSNLMPTSAREFINYEKYLWPKPSNGIYLA
jgi:hypothetical protein